MTVSALMPFQLSVAETTATAVRAPQDASGTAVAAALDLPPPRALFVLMGGAGGMEEATRDQVAAHVEALGHRLARDGVTVLDGGTASGVMKMMGEALGAHDLTAPYIGVVPAQAESDGAKAETLLQPHHSHFVLVAADDWGGETSLMYALVDALDDDCPTAGLLVNGGDIALEEASCLVGLGHELFVLAGSGRLADEVAAARGDPGGRHPPGVVALAGNDRVTVIDREQSPAEIVDIIARHLAPAPTARRQSSTMDTKALDATATPLNDHAPATAPAARRPATLVNAWRRLAFYDHHAKLAQRRFLQIRWLLLILPLLSTTLAIIHVLLTNALERQVSLPIWTNAQWQAFNEPYLNFLVIALPILITVLVAIDVKFQIGFNWILLRNSAEQIKREIFRYRTRNEIYSDANTDDYNTRDLKLARKLKTISGRLMKTQVNKAELGTFETDLPPQFAAHADDDGFSDLDPERYLHWRLEDQLEFFRDRSVKLARAVRNGNRAVILLGGLSTLLAAIQQEIWIAVSNAMVVAVVGYMETRRYEETLITYNQSATDLENIRAWWDALSPPAQRDPENFGRLVKNAENILMSEHARWVQEMRDSLAELYRPEDERETEED